MQITFETRKRNTRFYVSRQAVQEGRFSEGYASFKQVKPWPWHVEVIRGVSVVGLVTNKELCKVVWGIIILSTLGTERERERERETERDRDRDRQTDRHRYRQKERCCEYLPVANCTHAHARTHTHTLSLSLELPSGTSCLKR